MIVYIWWPLADEYLAYMDWRGPWWIYLDWLLIGIFSFMTITLVAGADIRNDLFIVIVGLVGGLVIEAWGTQTNLWFYYTAERPPLWIIPAWPISALSIDRITKLLQRMTSWIDQRASMLSKEAPPVSIYQIIYWVIFLAFMAIMVEFIAPTFDKPFTWFALLISFYLVVTPTDHKHALLIFVAGAGLGYFLERWGTTRECWTYYNFQTPPIFAVLAHGLAAVAFWRSTVYLTKLFVRLTTFDRLQISSSLD